MHILHYVQHIEAMLLRFALLSVCVRFMMCVVVPGAFVVHVDSGKCIFKPNEGGVKQVGVGTNHDPVNSRGANSVLDPII